MRKICTNCNIEKDVKYFYLKKGGLFDRHAECKECLKNKNKIYRENNKDKIFIKDVVYRQKLKELYSDSSYSSRVCMAERSIIGFERYAEKKMQLLAGSLLNYAIRKKIIEKPNICSICKKEKEIEGHHPDYSKPLQVSWVCIECHSKFHTNSR